MNSHSRLTIDLSAITENYRLLKSSAGLADLAVVLKGDAYNMGMAVIARTLVEEGARCFFVAFGSEALALRRILKDMNAPGKIYVIAGLHSRYFESYLEHDLIPVLNSLDHVRGWAEQARRKGCKLPGVIQVDIGLNRLGLSFDDFVKLVTKTDLLDHLAPDLIIGHLPFGNNPGHPKNRSHLSHFQTFKNMLPHWRGSVANSAAVFLGLEFHHDLVRVGSALFGVNPTRGQENPMLPVVSLESHIIQLRNLEAGQTIGYGGTFTASRKIQLGIVAIGASDGIDRALSSGGLGCVYIKGHRAKIIGSGGSDMIFIDLSEIPTSLAIIGQEVELLGRNNDLAAMAAQAGASEYDILSGFGQRPERIYLKNQ